MELEIINKLFLELSQVTTAKTARELALEHQVEWLQQKLNAAPAQDVVRDAKVGAAIERAARELPRHYWIEIEIENVEATVRLYDDECARLGYDTDGETLASEINSAIDAALLAASKKEGV